MSELIEINEGNCVLEDFELDNISNAFYHYKEMEGKWAQEIFDIYLQKINKLNEMAKEKQK